MAIFPTDTELTQDESSDLKKPRFLSWLRRCRQLLGGSVESPLTIASDAATPTGSTHTLETEGGATSDTLATLNTANVEDGAIVILRAASGRSVAVTHSSTGSAGSIRLADSANFTLTGNHRLTLQRVGASWVEVSRYGVGVGRAASAVTADACSGNAATATTLAAGSVLPADKGGTGVTSLAALSSKLNVAPFPAGTRMLFHQSSAPTGWTKDTSINDKALRVVSGAVASGGVTDFSSIFSRTIVDSTTLVASQMPGHAHEVIDSAGTYVKRPSVAGGSVRVIFSIDNGFGGTRSTQLFTGTQGSNDSHTHGLDLRLAYIDVIIATKD